MNIQDPVLRRRLSSFAHYHLVTSRKGEGDEGAPLLPKPLNGVVHVKLPEAPGKATLYVTGGIIPGLSNEFTMAVNPDNPSMVSVSANDYSDSKPHGYVETSQDAAQNFTRNRIEAKEDALRPVNGDMILRPKPGGGFYGAEMGFDFNNQDNNGMKVFTVNADGTVDPKSVQYVVKHQAGKGGSQNFEDKENLAVDLDPGSKSYGWRLFTNTQFHPDNSSQINVYVVDPQNKMGSAVNITAPTKQNQVQWSAPVFGKGGTMDVAYRDFNDSSIYDAHSSGIQVTGNIAKTWKGKIKKSVTAPKFSVKFDAAKPIAAIGAPVETYFQKYDSNFRSLSGPQMAGNPADGSLYMVYNDAKSGKSQTYLVTGDGSGKWSSPVAIGNPNVDHWMSSVSVDSKTGIVAVTYRALQSDGDTYTREGILSFDGGKTWTDPVDLSLHPSMRTQDGFQGQFDGDYEETGLGTTSDGKGSTMLHFYAPHQETPYEKDTTTPTLRVGTLIANLPTDLLTKAKGGDSNALSQLNTLVNDAAAGVPGSKQAVPA